MRGKKAEHKLDESHMERNWDAALVPIHVKIQTMDLLPLLTEILLHLGIMEEHPLEYM